MRFGPIRIAGIFPWTLAHELSRLGEARVILLETLFSLQATPSAADPPPANAPLALLILLVAVAAWFGLRTLVRGMRAGKAASTVHGDFNAFAREALINAAKIDGRVDERERAAIGAAL